MSKFSADQATIINEQVARINAAANHGTLDLATVNDACDKLKAMTQTGPVPNSLGGNSVVQNRAAPTPHAGEPAETDFHDGRTVAPDGRPVRNDGRPVNR